MEEEKNYIWKEKNPRGVLSKSKVISVDDYNTCIELASQIHLICDNLEKLQEEDFISEYAFDRLQDAINGVMKAEDSMLVNAIYFTDKKEDYIWDIE